MNLFARIGNKAVVDAKIKEAETLGATVKRDNEAKTVEVTFEGETLFKALAKGGGAWLVMYNPNFYPK